ncbi:MAG: UDP-N-acetylglucosamine 2-epimerase (non-hydrolyzing) [Planctomycetaceae bacterium]
MKRLKVMTIVGTRPEIIKLSRVIAELDQHVDHVLVHSGQNYDYELNQVFFDQLQIRPPDRFLNAVGETPAETIGKVIALSDAAMAEERPDATLFYGDTNTCLAAISAKRRKIPVFHMEAGNRCFDDRVPEEINRRILDHISDINLPLTEHARRYLLAEGIRPETIIKSGSCMEEVLDYYRPGIESSRILEELGLTEGGYFVVSTHREENVDSPELLTTLLNTLDTLVERYKLPIIVSVHPRTRKRLAALGRELDESGQGMIRASKPFGFLDYVKLQTHAFCVLSDSGTISEESSLLNFPAVNLRQAHERPEAMDEGTLIMSGLEPDRVIQSVDIVTSQFDKNRRVMRVVQDYEGGPVSKKMVRIILSYTDYINRTVWRK